jgi:hypothetical protein
MIEFPFKQIRTSALGVILRPIATVRLTGPKNSLTAEFLIDSGADITIIPREVGRFLGFKVKEDERIINFGGIGGQIPCAERMVGMTIGEVKFNCRVAWAFTEDVPLLLGRVEVFDRFEINFRQKEGKTVFKLSEE